MKSTYCLLIVDQIIFCNKDSNVYRNKVSVCYKQDMVLVEIQHSHGGEYEDSCIQECGVV
jgi:hypothetical protein